MKIETKYNLYPNLPEDLQKEADKIAGDLKALRARFESWAKKEDENVQRQVGLIPIPGQRLRVSDPVMSHLLTKVIVPKTIPLPKWCENGKTEGFHLAAGAIFNSGAFCFFYGKDPDHPENTLVLLQQRKETAPVMKEGNNSSSDLPYVRGALGGYMKKGEAASVTAIREAVEELPRYRSQPLFKIDERRMALIHEDRDYVSQRPPVQYSAYAYELTPEDIRAIKKALADQKYRTECHKYTEGETTDIMLEPIEKVLEEGHDRFRYIEQFKILQEIGSRLRGKEPSSPMGFTMGDSHAYLNLHRRMQTIGIPRKR